MDTKSNLYSQSFIDLGNNALHYIQINTIITDFDFHGVHLVAILLNIITLNLARFSYCSYHFTLNRDNSSKVLNRALICEAGKAGQMMLKEIQCNVAYNRNLYVL